MQAGWGGRLPFSEWRVSGNSPARSTCVSSCLAQRSASAFVSKLRARGARPRRRTCACQRPLSFLIVAMIVLRVAVTEGHPLWPAKDDPGTRGRQRAAIVPKPHPGAQHSERYASRIKDFRYLSRGLGQSHALLCVGKVVIPSSCSLLIKATD